MQMAASLQGDTAIPSGVLLPPPSPGLIIPVTWWHASPLANMSRRRDKVPRRRHYIARSPPAPVVSVRLACADADRREPERPCDGCSRCDPLQFHRELLYRLAALPLPRKAACRTLAKTAGRSRLFPDVYIVPPAALVSHHQAAATGDRLCHFVYWIAGHPYRITRLGHDHTAGGPRLRRLASR